MVRIALCWASAGNWPSDHVQEGCSAGLVPGTGYLTFEVDVDLTTCDFAALVEAAVAHLPPLHRPVGFNFQGKDIRPGAALRAYGVKRGDTVYANVRREPFEFDKTGPPAIAGDGEDGDDGARE